MLQIPVRRVAMHFYASPGQFDHEPALSVTAVRWLVKLQFQMGPTTDPLPHVAILDTGAPFNVVPYGVRERIRWASSGRQLTPKQVAKDQPPELAILAEWENIACDFGRAWPCAIDPDDNKISSAVCLLVGKFATEPHRVAARDKHILLGANFLLDNNAQLVLNAPGRPFDYLQFND